MGEIGMAANPYKNIGMDHTRVEEAIVALGAVDVGIKVVKSDAQVHYSGSLDGTPFLVNLLINKDGKCTIGYSTGFDRPIFERVAEAIAAHCRYAERKRLEASIAGFEAGQLEDMLAYMRSEQVEIADESTPAYQLLRLRGLRGDQLILKYYPNKTLQLQGSHAQLASFALSYLQAVLPLDDLLAHQRAVYEIPITVDQIKLDLAARIPAVHDWLEDAIRIQLTSALALTKVGIELEDYGAIAFPAFRGLEGFCYQVLAAHVGVAPTVKDSLGNYFDSEPSGTALLSLYRTSCPDEVATALVECYTHWQKHRHRLFHMDGTLVTTRLLEDREEAVALVEEVLNLVERIHAVLSK